MDAIVNAVALLIITYLQYKALKSRGAYLADPLDKSTMIYVDNHELFFIWLFSTGLFQCGELLAIRLFILELLCLYVIFSCRRKAVVSWPLAIYIIYMLWLCIGCTYTSAPIYGIRMILKYVYPLLAALMASKIMVCHEVLRISFHRARQIALIAAILCIVPFIESVAPTLLWYGTARTIHFISIICICLALYYLAEPKDKRERMTAYVLMVPCVLWVFRTSILGTTCALAFFSSMKNGIKSVFTLVIIGTAFLGIVFMLPSVQEKMFRGTTKYSIEDLLTGEISKDDIDSNGRFHMWEIAERRFYEGHELMGSGSGMVQEFMYSNGEKQFAGVKIIHNDYLQMKCDNGLIGFWLFLLAELGIVLHCTVVFRKTDDRWVKICALSAGSSMVGVALTLITDNVVNYSMVTLSYPFMLYGSMLGLIYHREDQ